MVKRKADILDHNPRPQKGKLLGTVTSSFERSLPDLIGRSKLSRSTLTHVQKPALERFCGEHGIQTNPSGRRGQATKDDLIDGILDRCVCCVLL